MLLNRHELEGLSPSQLPELQFNWDTSPTAYLHTVDPPSGLLPKDHVPHEYKLSLGWAPLRSIDQNLSAYSRQDHMKDFWSRGEPHWAAAHNPSFQRTPSEPLKSSVVPPIFSPFKPMHIQNPFTFANALALGVWRSVGIRLLACWGLARGCMVFLASGSYPASARSSGFSSVWSVFARHFSCAGSTPSLKPTRILRAAYPVR
jgi:hypothetical protein